MRFILILISMLLASQAVAGPWPRGAGQTFFAASVRMQQNVDGEYKPNIAYYHETGISRRLTFGADIGGSIAGLDKAVAFLSTHLPTTGAWAIGLDMGGGMISEEPVVRPGFSFGRKLARKSGWLTIEGAVEYSPRIAETDWKLDLTYGFQQREGLKYYVQVQSGQPHAQPTFLRVAGSVTYRIAPRTWLDVGVSSRVVNSDPVRVKLGIWRSF
ncbi:hypothetical protein [Pseudooceanicola aestuarii]|uniref:hypothetical protein n=1 Tax=Pseudooceanicola aestuarii TaxID=2697319 RepID=UPI0013D0C987|nr:hypothetical protein [Pseudooceanicola aestuarii]